MLNAGVKLKFAGTMFFLVLGAMMFSFAEGLAPSAATADGSCPEYGCPPDQVCCGGTCIDPETTGCCADQPYNLEEYCCIE